MLAGCSSRRQIHAAVGCLIDAPQIPAVTSVVACECGFATAGDGIVDMKDLELQSSIARDRATVARGMSPGMKLVAGASLFDTVRQRMLDGIRGRHPEWSPSAVEDEFRRQLALIREREDRGVFSPCGFP